MVELAPEVVHKSQSSVKIATNKDGTKSTEVKVYADSIEDAVNLAVLKDKELHTKMEVK